MFPLRGSIAFVVGVCTAVGLSVHGVEDAVEDLTALLQNKVEGPITEQDEADLRAAEADWLREKRQRKRAEEAKAKEQQAQRADQDAVNAELEAMQAEDAEDSEAPEQGDVAAEPEPTEQVEEVPQVDPEVAKQAIRERIAERARLAQAANYTFSVGSTVWVQGKKCQVYWDGRPDHEYVKVTWLEGKETGKNSGVIDVEDVSINEGESMVEIGSGRHKRKMLASTWKLEEQQKALAKKVRDSSRRRRSVLRRMVYGIKKLPMVMSIPFRGLKTGVETIRSEMTIHTGLAFNGTLVDLLESSKPRMQPGPLPEEDVVEAPLPSRRKKNLTDIVRNRTVHNVMNFNKAHVGSLMNAFTSDIRLSGSDLSNIIGQTNLTASARGNRGTVSDQV